MRFAGIDVGSRAHVVAIVDEAGSVLVRPTAFAEDASGYARLFSVLADPTDLLVAMEATGHYGRNLLSAITGRGFRAALVNPIRTRRFAEEDLARAKTDSIDALGIARFAAQKRPAPTPVRDAATDELRETVRFRERIAQDLGDRIRQLHRLVALGFPELIRHVRTLDSQRATLILRELPTAAAFDQTSLSQLAQLRSGDKRRIGETLARKLIDAARISVGCHHGAAYAKSVRFTCEDIEALRRRLHDLDSDIAIAVRQHSVAALLATIRGLGDLSAARIVAAVGDPAVFRHAGAFAAYVGVVPRTSQSGTRRPSAASLSPLGNARLRRALYMTTFAAIRLNPWLRAYYQRLRAKGKPAKVAILAAERKLLTAIYAVAKSKKPFVLRPADDSPM